MIVLRYAFIEFASFEDAKEALNSCNKREIEGRAIRLELQGPRGSPNARSRELYLIGYGVVGQQSSVCCCIGVFCFGGSFGFDLEMNFFVYLLLLSEGYWI